MFVTLRVVPPRVVSGSATPCRSFLHVDVRSLRLRSKGAHRRMDSVTVHPFDFLSHTNAPRNGKGPVNLAFSSCIPLQAYIATEKL